MKGDCVVVDSLTLTRYHLIIVLGQGLKNVESHSQVVIPLINDFHLPFKKVFARKPNRRRD